jgi:hypothetical protein
LIIILGAACAARVLAAESSIVGPAASRWRHRVTSK